MQTASKTTTINLSATLSKFKKELDEKKISVVNKKETIYNYPEGFSANEINSQKGKAHRTKLRHALKRFSNNIFAFAKINEEEKLLNEIKLFNAFYKENYRLNSYTLESLSSSKNEDNAKDINLMFDIIKAVESKAPVAEKKVSAPKVKK